MATKRQIAKERKNLMDLMDGELYYDDRKYPVAKRMVDENIIIGTWNIEKLGRRHDKRALQYIADIIERFDVIALQEVVTYLRNLETIMELLPGDYDILLSDVTGNYERFAFIYDKRTVRTTGFVSDLGFEENSSTQLRRMPYCASFRAGRFDFVLVTVHIFQGNADIREQEIKDLSAHLVAKAKKFDSKRVFDPDFFILGDFNIDKHNDRFYKALDKHFKMPKKMNNLYTNWGEDKTFDKIATSSRRFPPSRPVRAT